MDSLLDSSTSPSPVLPSATQEKDLSELLTPEPTPLVAPSPSGENNFGESLSPAGLSPANSMGRLSGAATDEDDDEEVHDIEPKFKYERLLSDRSAESANILFRDSATTLAVHPKFLALGTKNGEIHVLDLQGNRSTLTVPIPKHAGPVNDISIDDAGDYMASAGEDGKVFVQGLISTEDNFVVKHSEPIRAVAISPNFSVSGLHLPNRSIIFGSRQLVLCEKKLFGPKSTVLDGNRLEPGVDGRVTRIKWFGNMVAWANSTGVKVMCLKDKQIIGLIPRDKRDTEFDFPNKCDIYWMDARTLIVSWPHVFHICSIRDRKRASNSSLSSGGLTSKSLPNFELVISKMVHTDFAICGIGPYVNEQFVLLGYNASAKEEDKKVQLRVIQPHWEEYDDITCDVLVLRGTLYAAYEDYKLQCLPEDGLYFVVSPKDIVVAKPLDLDDVIDWLLERGKFDEAMTVATKDAGRQITKHNIRDIGRRYLEYLRLRNDFEIAARICPKILGKDKNAWEEQIAEFHKAGKLAILAPYLPRSNEFQLTPAVYELVLSTFLQTDQEGFLRIIKEWPHALYNVQAVINAVIDVLLRNPNQKVLLEALGALYSFIKQFDKALAIYVKLKHPDVFDLIAKHRLFRTVADKQLAIALMEVDAEQAIRLLTENIDAIPMVKVIAQLEQKPPFLLQYLDRLFQKDKIIGKDYHDVQVKLYAEHDPKKMLHFMQNSKHFSLRNAYEICQKKNMVPEMVYLLSRMGNPREALELILSQLKDITRAIDFCKEQNDNDLWMILIDYALDKPQFITNLLHNIGTHVDPSILIRRIKLGLQIPGLRDSLVCILQDYNLQITLREGCKKIMVSDCYQLLVKLLKLRQRGFTVDLESTCPACQESVLPCDAESASGLTVYQCKHAFHTNCVLLAGPGCPVCAPKQRYEMFT
ncbi:Vacuolar protein sorting-associated protein 41-like protein [Hypsibius exemplaris]|uniref:Vacuolar protein sorting-associated protein 41-like protein n=1 Tax=Hypsibius exemplaris TaxID=2072580 RepID=A0A9X6NEA3_HYPEX|nr:Vacuolar protein sorting-associated protein 41-like protein [Hypsibius exemplaris]